MLFGACCDHPFSFSVFVFASLNISVTRYMPVCLSVAPRRCVSVPSFVFVRVPSVCLSFFLFFLSPLPPVFFCFVFCCCWVVGFLVCFVVVVVFFSFTFVVFLFFVVVILLLLSLFLSSSCWLSWECLFFFSFLSFFLPPLPLLQ